MPTRRHFLRAAGATSTSTLLQPNWLSAQSPFVALPGGNPILPGSGLCDPQIRVYKDLDGTPRVYLYATHDFSPANKYYEMHDWWVWTTTDLIHWQQVSTLRPEQTYFHKPSNECWATDAISHNGKYYFYFSRGPKEIGVVVGDTPRGPWRDPLDKPLVADGQTATEARDPGVLQEDDGTTYLIFGLGDYFIARLNGDMISFAETPRKVVIHNQSGPYGPHTGDDKPFLFKRGGIYYLSWGCYYATSKDIYGPYEYKDTIIKADHTAPEFQKGLTLDRHGSFFELHGQWYFICNDQSFPGQGPYFRTAVLSYIHFRDNGDIATLDLNRLGVAQYDATAPSIAAANFFKIDGGTIGEAPTGSMIEFEVRGLRNESYLVYLNVCNLRANARITFVGSSTHGATIQVRANSPTGELLASCKLAPTGDWLTYKTATTILRNKEGKTNVCFTVHGNAGELLRLNSFFFS
jgi:arabinoxylan arabinofuranohydrolase